MDGCGDAREWGREEGEKVVMFCYEQNNEERKRASERGVSRARRRGAPFSNKAAQPQPNRGGQSHAGA